MDFMALQFFFILSGFILSHVYLKKIKSNNFSNREFLIKRFNSLYPIHIFTMILAIFTFILLSIVTNKQFPIEVNYQTVPTIPPLGQMEVHISDIKNYIIQSFLLIQAWENRYLFLNPAAWSVSALFFFYLTFYSLTSWVSSKKNLFSLLFLIWIISLFYPLYMISNSDFSSESLGILHRNPILRLSDFLAGIIFYFICNKYPYQDKLKFPSLIFAILGFFAIYYFVKLEPYSGYVLSHNGLFLFTQLALIYYFLSLNINSIKISNLVERLGKASLTIYMLHLPLLAIYFILYKIVIASFYSQSISDLIVNAKNIENLDNLGLILFVVILIPLSIWIQEKIFTPLQFKLNNKILKSKLDSKPIKS